MRMPTGGGISLLFRERSLVLGNDETRMDKGFSAFFYDSSIHTPTYTKTHYLHTKLAVFFLLYVYGYVYPGNYRLNRLLTLYPCGFHRSRKGRNFQETFRERSPRWLFHTPRPTTLN